MAKVANYRSATIKSKWIKTKWMVRDRNLKHYIPETGIYQKASLKRFAKKYKLIYFKPTFGSGGFHIARIERIKKNKFLVKSDSGKSVAPSVDNLYQRLNKMTKGKSYLLQRGIYLKHSGIHPFDLRVMVQKSRGWAVSACFSKLGKQGKVATNYHQGGKLWYLDQTLRGAGYSKTKIAAIHKQLHRMGIHTGKCFDRHRKGFRELGLDVAIDRKNRFWVLEVNTRPQFYPLKYLKNKTMYRTILKYGKHYGRKK